MLTVVLLSGVELGIAASGAELDGIGVVADLNNDVEFRTSVTSVLRVTPDSNLCLSTLSSLERSARMKGLPMSPPAKLGYS